MTPQKILKIMGVAFVLIGIAGFIPGLTTDNYIFGYLHINPLLNLVHLATGGAIMYAVMAPEATAKQVLKVLGIVYAAIVVLGLFAGTDAILGILPNNKANMLLHVAAALPLLYWSFGSQPVTA